MLGYDMWSKLSDIIAKIDEMSSASGMDKVKERRRVASPAVEINTNLFGNFATLTLTFSYWRNTFSSNGSLTAFCCSRVAGGCFAGSAVVE